MIAFVSGEVVDKTAGMITIDTGGLGYELYITDYDSEELTIGDNVKLNTYFHVRENSQELFGFVSSDSKALFEQLIAVSGVGPKMAMSILSLGPAEQIKKAIADGNTAYISGASGVGKRLAERVVVELKDKVGIVAGVDISDITSNTSDEVVDALIGLGYNRSQALQAAAKTDKSASSEDRIKQALSKI